MKLYAYHFNDNLDKGYEFKHFELDDLRVLYRYYEDDNSEALANDPLLCWLDDIFYGYSVDVMEAIQDLKKGLAFTTTTDGGVVGISSTREDAILKAVFLEFGSIYGVNIEKILNEKP